MKKIMNIAEKVYLTILMPYLMLNCMLPFLVYLGSPQRAAVSSILIIIGVFIVCYNIITNREKIFKNNSLILYIFVGAIAISSISMIKYGIMDNVKTIVWSIINFALLYNVTTQWDKKELCKWGKVLYYILSIIWSIAIIYSIYQFVNEIGYEVKSETFSGNKGQGLYYNRLFGIFFDPNFAAATSTVILFFSLYFFTKASNVALKLCDLLIALLQLIYISLSNSRTGLVMLCVGFFVSCFLLFRNKFYKNNRKYINLKSICMAFLGIVLSIVMAFGVKKVFTLFIDFNKINNEIITVKVITRENDKFVINNWHLDKSGKEISIENLDSNSVNNEKTDSQSVDDNNNIGNISNAENNRTSATKTLDRKDLEGKEDFSNMRFQLWKQSVSIAKNRWVFGLSPRNFDAYALENYPDSLPANGLDCGNGFISLFVYTGVFGMTIMVIFIILTLKTVCAYILKTKEIDILDILLITEITCIAIDAAINQEVFMINSINTAIFWSVLGLLITRISNRVKVHTNKTIV